MRRAVWDRGLVLRSYRNVLNVNPLYVMRGT